MSGELFRAVAFLAGVVRVEEFFAAGLRLTLFFAVLFFGADLRADDLRAADFFAVVRLDAVFAVDLRAVVFFGGDFLVVAFFAEALRVVAFFAAGLRAVDFFALVFLAAGLRPEVFLGLAFIEAAFFATDFFELVRFAVDLRAEDFFAAGLRVAAARFGVRFVERLVVVGMGLFLVSSDASPLGPVRLLSSPRGSGTRRPARASAAGGALRAQAHLTDPLVRQVSTRGSGRISKSSRTVRLSAFVSTKRTTIGGWPPRARQNPRSLPRLNPTVRRPCLRPDRRSADASVLDMLLVYSP